MLCCCWDIAETALAWHYLYGRESEAGDRTIARVQTLEAQSRNGILYSQDINIQHESRNCFSSTLRLQANTPPTDGYDIYSGIHTWFFFPEYMYLLSGDDWYCNIADGISVLLITNATEKSSSSKDLTQQQGNAMEALEKMSLLSMIKASQTAF